MYEYRATVERVIDGDTLDLQVDLGFDVRIKQRLRLRGVNAPEKNTDAGQAALEFVQDWVKEHGPSFVVSTDHDQHEKYGRLLATLTAVEVDADGNELTSELTDELVHAGHAEPYSGGHRD